MFQLKQQCVHRLTINGSLEREVDVYLSTLAEGTAIGNNIGICVN